jgi:hypothetical protein
VAVALAWLFRRATPQLQRAGEMILDLRQRLLCEGLQIRIGAIGDLVPVKSSVGLLVIHLPAYVVVVEFPACLMIQDLDPQDTGRGLAFTGSLVRRRFRLP